MPEKVSRAAMLSRGASGGGTVDAESDMYCRQVCERLNEQRKEGGVFCDILLKVGGLTLPGHACVLSACSPFFRALICGQQASPPHLKSLPQEIELHMPGIQTQHLSPEPASPPDTATDTVGQPATMTEGLETVLDVIDYIYTGRIELRKDSVHLLVQLAEALALDELSALVRNFVRGAGARIDCSDRTEVCQTKLAESRKSLGPTKRLAKKVLAVQIQSTKQNQSPKQRKRKVTTKKIVMTSRLPPDDPVIDIPNEEQAPRTKKKLEISLSEPTTRALRSQKQTTRVALSTSNTDTEENDDDESSTDLTADNNGQPPGRRIIQRGTYKCDECDFKSNEASAVREHVQIHTRSKSFACLSCGHFTGYHPKMLAHLLAANHPETRCSLCGADSTNRTAFLEHLKKHEDTKPFFCQLCEMRFRIKSHLTRHLARHSDDRPFVCDVCGRGFKNKHFMLMHVTNHNAVKNFPCPQCSYMTAFKTNLKMHMRVHKEGKIACPREGCKFQSVSKYNLKSHLLTHAKQKPFQCEVCGQKFAQERSRRRHAKIHDPESILRCAQCPFSTICSQRLSEHVYKVHENGPPVPVKRRVRKSRSSSRLPADPGRPVSPIALPSSQMVAEHYRMVYEDCQPVTGSLDSYTPRMWLS